MCCLTPEERVANLQECAENFNTHLKETPGVVLTGPLRWAVVVCARDALLNCPCASQLSRDACL